MYSELRSFNKVISIDEKLPPLKIAYLNLIIAKELRIGLNLVRY
jgi:hypothetical protein